ncbi:hypothetical protein HRW17_37450 [Streptomyces lunaelactis]|nr:hypothetical protein [Streptomyces lunaelactis]
MTFFQPATKAMEALGVRLAAGAPASGANGAGGPADTAPSAAAGAVPPGSPGSSGSADGLRRVTGIVDFDYFGSLGPGLVVIGASLAGLLGARWILSAQERREFRSFSLASWG